MRALIPVKSWAESVRRQNPAPRLLKNCSCAHAGGYGLRLESLQVHLLDDGLGFKGLGADRGIWCLRFCFCPKPDQPHLQSNALHLVHPDAFPRRTEIMNPKAPTSTSHAPKLQRSLAILKPCTLKPTYASSHHGPARQLGAVPCP